MKPTDEQVERVKTAISEKFAPAIDFRAPYAKVMLDAAARAAIAAMPEPWMQIDDNTPADQDLQLGWWEKWPERAWMQRIGYARSTRGGWNDGRPTHWRHLPSPPQKDEQP